MKSLVFISIIIIAASDPAGAQTALIPGTVDATGFPVVTFGFRLENAGVPVTTSDASMLRISEDGVAVPAVIQCPEIQTIPASFALGVERSLTENLPAARDAARKFLAARTFYDGGTECALWTFATFITREHSMTRDSAALASIVASLTDAPFPFNGTALYETMFRAIDDINVDGSSLVKSIVFVTDGVNNTSNYDRSLDDVIAQARLKNIRVYVLGVGDKPDGIAAMQAVCNGTGGFYVPIANPAACDSISRAASLQPAYTYWCTATYTSPACPNGAPHVAGVTYRPDAPDSLRVTAPYAAPRIEAQLAALPFWITPESVSGAAGDTLDLALGMTPAAEFAPDSMRLVIAHDGLARAGVFLQDRAVADWIIAVQSAGAQSIVTLRPPPGARLGAGMHRLVKIPFVRIRAGATQPVLTREEGRDCAVLTKGMVAKDLRIEADTVLVARGSSADLPVRLARNAMPEGVRDAAFTMTFASGAVAAAPLRFIAAGPGWRVLADTTFDDAGATVVRCILRGPSVDTAAALGVLRIPLRASAPPAIPVPLAVDGVNFAPPGDASAGPGLVLLRDSCFNDIVRLAGLAVAGPWPQPVRASARFLVRSAQPMRVECRLRDALGRVRGTMQSRECDAAGARFDLGTEELEAGVYIAWFTTDRESVPVKFIRIE